VFLVSKTLIQFVIDEVLIDRFVDRWAQISGASDTCCWNFVTLEGKILHRSRYRDLCWIFEWSPKWSSGRLVETSIQFFYKFFLFSSFPCFRNDLFKSDIYYYLLLYYLM